MDDDLMRLFGGERMKKIMSRVGMVPGEPINHPWLNKSIEKAQKKVEERNFEIRKNLLDYDDVLNQQRSFIYEQRDEILADENLSRRVMDNAKETVAQIFDEYEQLSRHSKGSNTKSALADRIRNDFGQTIGYDQLTQEGVEAVLQNDITQKEMLVGKQNFNMFIRYQYIQMIDKKWLDQLEFLDGLREAVYLRSYGSKNPLTEYKIDGFNAFDAMLSSIRDAVESRVFKVKIQVHPAGMEPQRPQQQVHNMTAQHEEAQPAIASSAKKDAENSAMKSGRQGQSITMMRTSPKIGRNDPCPCGSGKKYKNCHGRNA